MKPASICALFLMALILSGCINKEAYRKLEDSYLPTKQTIPMSSKVRWDCGRDVVFEPGGINVHYAELVRPDDNCSKKTPPWVLGESYKNKKWARPDLPGKAHLTEICNYPKIPLHDCQKAGAHILHVPNTDHKLGAVNVWEISNKSLDGVLSENGVTNLRGSERIHYAMYIIEGHKLPLGGRFLGRFPQGYMDSPNNPTVKSTFTTINGLKWKHARYNRRPKPSDPPRELYDQTEMYLAEVGNYSILIYGIYNDPMYKYPDWLAKRQAFLREWIETFKIEPLPAGYRKVQ